jgi:hypothetical protein
VTQATGKEFEEYVGQKIDALLRRHCGLTIVEGSTRDLPRTHDSAGDVQWDGRYCVVCAPASWSPSPSSAAFVVYGETGAVGGFARPPALETARVLSRSANCLCDYLAIFEFTIASNWSVRTSVGKEKRESLLQRLEDRLDFCAKRLLEKALVAIPDADGDPVAREVAVVLNAVAVIGVVATTACSESVKNILASSECPYPRLKALNSRGRFVCIIAHVTKTTKAWLLTPGGDSPRDAGTEAGSDI